MKAFKTFSLYSVIATYLLILLGGLVRVSGAGLGCPDWPKCFDRWIPPTNVSQLPSHFDPSQFNFTLAWLEYINRVAGMVVGLLILVTAVLAIRYYRHNYQILIPALLAAILVAIQGWLGGQVVSTELKPLIVSIHMGVAFIIISLLLYILAQVHFSPDADIQSKSLIPASFRWTFLILWSVVIIQIILGTQVRSSIEILAQNYPLLQNSDLLDKIGIVDEIHKTLGLIIAIGTWGIGYFILKRKYRSPHSVIKMTWLAMGLVFTQIILGFILTFAGLPSLSKLFHLWIASLYIGTLLILYMNLKKAGVQKYAVN